MTRRPFIQCLATAMAAFVFREPKDGEWKIIGGPSNGRMVDYVFDPSIKDRNGHQWAVEQFAATDGDRCDLDFGKEGPLQAGQIYQAYYVADPEAKTLTFQRDRRINCLIPTSRSV